MQDTPYGFHANTWQDEAKWVVIQSDVEEEIERINNSAPGPDGIPDLAWRKVARLAVAIIHNALHQIQRENF